MTKLITIVGATGAQGQGVVKAFITDPTHYKVRAITRNPSSASALRLIAQGAEVVSADLNDVASLTAAFAGSHIIYGMTNFFEPFVAHQSPTKAMEIETRHGINLARAAAATPTLQHYIWSTVPNARVLSRGRHLIPHFEGKNRVDAYIREKEPELREKTTFLWVAFYHSNIALPTFRPFVVPTTEGGRYVQLANMAADTPVPNIGNVSVNVAPFVRAVVEQPGKTQGSKVVLAACGEFGAEESLQVWARAKGVEARYVRVGVADYKALWPLWGEEMGVMMEYWNEYRERGWVDVDGGEVVTKEDLGVSGLQSLEEAYKGLEM